MAFLVWDEDEHEFIDIPIVTAKGDFLGQRDLWPFIKHSISTDNRAESRFKLQNKTQD